MSTVVMWLTLTGGALILAAVVGCWMYGEGRLPRTAALVQRWRIARTERLCRSGRRLCGVCAHVQVQDMFAEQVRRETEGDR